MSALKFHPQAFLEKARLLADGFAPKARKPVLNRGNWHATAKASGVLADAGGGVSELYLYDVIGGWWAGITADWMRRELEALKGTTTRLNIFVNSPGGDVFEAKAILSLLQRFSAEKVLYVDGLIASAATFIAMGADRIVTAPHATWMIHEASAGVWGPAAAHEKISELLKVENGAIAGAYATRTKQTTEKLLELMAAETWMTPTEAKDLGFTDSVATFDQDNAAPEKDVAAASARAQVAAFAARRFIRSTR